MANANKLLLKQIDGLLIFIILLLIVFLLESGGKQGATMKRVSSLALVILLAMGGFTKLHAQWPDDPNLNLVLSTRSGEQTITKVSPAPDGGCYVSWWDNTSGNYDMYLQRLDDNGVVQWANNGLLISNYPQETWLTDYDLATDSAGYAIIALNDIRAGGDWDIYAYRISPTGEFAWGSDGLTISNNIGFEPDPRIVVTAAGNIVFAWAEELVLHIRKVTPEGIDFWNPATITLTWTYSLSIPRLCAAQNDEFILQYLKAQGSGMYAPKHLYARKYDASGANLWGVEGVIVTNAGGFGPQMRPDLVPDEAGGAFSYWYDSRSVLHAYAQHIQPDGNMQWTANGVQLNTTSGELQMSPVLVYLPSSGYVITFFENTNSGQTIQGMYGQCLNQAGVRQWGSDGLVLHPMDNSTKMLLKATRMENDAVVTYLKTPLNDAVNSYVQSNRVDYYGARIWDGEPVIMATHLSSKGYLDACVNNVNQVIAVWQDKRSDSDGDVYLQNINPNGSLGPLGPITGTITGHVMQPDGTTPLNSAIVTNYDTLHVTGVDTTDAFGIYTFTLPPGTYSETFTKLGYRDTSLAGIIVTYGHDTPISVNMQQLTSNCHYVPGDINGNGSTNGIDVSYAVSYFKGGNVPPYSCDCNGSTWFVAGDVNGNCRFNGVDIVCLVHYLFPGGVLTPCPACPPTE